MQSALERVRQAARKDRKAQFTALLHHVHNLETLRAAYFALKREAAPGVDGETWRHYGQGLEENLRDLSDRLKRGAYRAKPVRRVFIPKADGRQRPLGVTALEDKLVQRATVEVLNAIYETDFLGFSYGFRPGRSQHNALDALYVGLLTKKVSWVLDLDIRGFFDAIDHGWLVKFIEHRIADQRVVRLIQKWLIAGVLEDGKRTRAQAGTPQGGSASPLLANIYLHYVFDLWVQAWRKKHARGDVIVVRFADDVVLGFQSEMEAKQFQAELTERFRKFNLELHPDKTRLIEFGPFAATNRRPERMLVANPEKNALQGDPRYEQAYRRIQQVNPTLLSAGIVRFLLARDTEADFAVAQDLTERLLDGRSVPYRVRDNITVMMLGLHCFEEYATGLGIALPELEVDAAITKMLEDLLESGGTQVKTGLDYFLEELSVMAVAGTLQHGRHYVYQSGRLALHFGACHAAYCEHTKRTAFEGEVPDRKAMRRMIVECYRRQGYVVDTDALVCFNGRGDRRRAVLVDLEEAKKNLNIDDFPEPDPDVGTGTGYRRWEDD